MKVYQLKKEYPNSPKLGSQVVSTSFSYALIGEKRKEFSIEEMENNPEFWKLEGVFIRLEPKVNLPILTADGVAAKEDDVVYVICTNSKGIAEYHAYKVKTLEGSFIEKNTVYFHEWGAKQYCEVYNRHWNKKRFSLSDVLENYQQTRDQMVERMSDL